MNSILRKLANQYISHDNKYEKDIELFALYMDPKKGNKLLDISKDDITASIKHYNIGDYRKIGSISTLNRYIVAVRAFFEFLAENAPIEYRNLFGKIYSDITVNGTYTRDVCEKEGLELDEVETRDAFEPYTIKQILSDLGKPPYKDRIKYKSLRIFIKITLLAYAKKLDVVNLKISENFKVEQRKLIINKCEIDVPKSLFDEIENYLEIRKKYNEENAIFDDMFFIHSKKTKIIDSASLNTLLGDFIHKTGILALSPKIKKRGDKFYSVPIEPIMNAALLDAIIQRANLVILAKLNGCNVQTLFDKFEEEILTSGILNAKLIDETIKLNSYYENL